jgi:hypothetical protein
MGHSRSVVIALISLAASVRAPADFHQPAPWRPARWAGPIADTAAVLAGTLVDADADRAVPYGTVALLGTEWAAFADANGAFRLGGLPAGTYIVRARQIGYTPKDTTVVIAPAPAITTLTFHMHRIPALLKLVKVEGHRSGRCVNTGIPDSTIDLPLARIFTHVGENVDLSLSLPARGEKPPAIGSWWRQHDIDRYGLVRIALEAALSSGWRDL